MTGLVEADPHDPSMRINGQLLGRILYSDLAAFRRILRQCETTLRPQLLAIGPFTAPAAASDACLRAILSGR